MTSDISISDRYCQDIIDPELQVTPHGVRVPLESLAGPKPQFRRRKFKLPSYLAILPVLILFYEAYNDHWYVPISDLLIPLVARIHRYEVRPEPLLFRRRSQLRFNSSANTLNLYPDFSRGLKVQPPIGMPYRAAVGSHQHQVASVQQI